MTAILKAEYKVDVVTDSEDDFEADMDIEELEYMELGSLAMELPDDTSITSAWLNTDVGIE